MEMEMPIAEFTEQSISNPAYYETGFRTGVIAGKIINYKTLYQL